MHKDVELTISSIQVQKFSNLFPLLEAMHKGTIYKVLYKPFGGDHRAC